MNTTTTTRARITYYAPDRTFVWLYKDQPFREFKLALRKKLVLLDDVTLYIKQIHGGDILDIDNEDEYEAFCDFARTAPTIDIRLSVVASGAPGEIHPFVKTDPQEHKSHEVEDHSDEAPASHSRIITTPFTEPELPTATKRKSLDSDIYLAMQKPSPRKKRKRGNDIESTEDQSLIQSPTPNFQPSIAPKSKLVDANSASNVLPTPYPITKKTTQKVKRRTSIASAAMLSQIEVQEGTPSSDAAPESSSIQELPVISNLACHPEHPVSLKKRQRDLEHTGGSISALKQRKKTKKDTGPTARGKVPMKEPTASSSQLPLIAENGPENAEFAAFTNPDDVPIPIEFENGTRATLHLHKGKTVAERDSGQPSLIRPLASPSVSFPSEPTISELPLEPSKTSKPADKSKVATVYTNEQPSSVDHPVLNGVALVSTKTTLEPEPKRGKRKTVSRPAVKTAQQSSTSLVKEMADPLKSLKVTKNTDVVDEGATSLPDTATHATETTEQTPLTKVTIPAADVKGSETNGKKKAKRSTKAKTPSSAMPPVDIQEVMNQVLAKNRATQKTTSESGVSGIAGSSTDKPALETDIVARDKVQPSPVAATSVTNGVPQEIKQSRVRKKAKSASEAPCPACNQSPFHLRYQCPLFTGGPETLQQRILELKARRPVPRTLIKELQGLLSKKTAKAQESVFASVEPADDVIKSLTSPETQSKGPSSAESEIQGDSVQTGIINSKESDSSDDDPEDGPVVPNAVSLRDPDDDLDALLRGPKLSTAQKILVSEVSSENEDEEREVLEVEDEEGDTKKFRHILKRFANSESSDSEDVVDDDHGSPSTESPAGDQLALQVLDNQTKPPRIEQSLGQKQISKTVVVQDDEVVPPTDDETENDGSGTWDCSLEGSMAPTKSQTNAAATGSLHSSTSDSSHPLKKRSRISELRTTKSVLKYLKDHVAEIVDPIEPSDDPPFHPTVNSVSLANAVGQADENRDLEKLTLEISIQSTPLLSRKMKDRCGTTVASLTASPVGFSVPAIVEETPARDSLPTMRPPPTPPWLSGEERCIPKKDPNPLGNKNMQSTPSQSFSQHHSSQSQVPPLQEQSLAEWTALPPAESPPPVVSESSMIDELHSSPGDDLPAAEMPALVVPPRHRKTKETPLFFPGTSQYPIPDSQLPHDDQQSDSNSSSTSESGKGSKMVGIQPQRSRSFSAGVPYRRLTDIASQGSIFASPLLRSVTPSFSTKRNVFSQGGNELEDEDDEDDDTSSSDSDEKEKSHIPKHRRAGTTQGKKRGLFASL